MGAFRREMKQTLFEEIGETKIRQSIERFYEKAFIDPIISHFFFKKIMITYRKCSFCLRQLCSALEATHTLVRL